MIIFLSNKFLNVIFFSWVIVLLLLSFCGGKNSQSEKDAALKSLKCITWKSGCPAPELRVLANDTNLASGETVDFGSLTLGGTEVTKIITIKNAGEKALTWEKVGISLFGSNISEFFLQVPQKQELEPGKITALSISFDPNSLGLKTASLKLTTNDPVNTNFQLTLTGTATTAPVGDIGISINSGNYNSGQTYSFGNVRLTLSGSLANFQVYNVGDAELHLQSPFFTITGADASSFTSTGTFSETTLAPKASTQISLRFKPQGPTGLKQAQINFFSDDPDSESEYSILLSGIAGPAPAPDISLTINNQDYTSGQSYDFGSLVINDSGPPVTLVIGNTGDYTLHLSEPAYALSGADAASFIVVSGPAFLDIEQLANVEMNLKFNPVNTTGQKSATLTIFSDDTDFESSFVLQLLGNATETPEPEIVVRIDSIYYSDIVGYTFSSTRLDETLPSATFTIENIGQAVLNLTLVDVTGVDLGEFDITPPSLSSLNPGEYTTFTVSFNPSDYDASTPVNNIKEAFISIENNDADESNLDIPITATVLAPFLNWCNEDVSLNCIGPSLATFKWDSSVWGN